MKTVIVLTTAQMKKFLETKTINDLVIINIKEDLKNDLSSIMEENTGYRFKPVIGVSSLFGNRNVIEDWKSLSTLVAMKSSDFILEFDIPEDLVATISYEDLVSLNKVDNLIIEELNQFLSLEEHCSDESIELAITPILKISYCTRYVYLNDSWEVEEVPIKSNENLQIEFQQRFKEV